MYEIGTPGLFALKLAPDVRNVLIASTCVAVACASPSLYPPVAAAIAAAASPPMPYARTVAELTTDL